MIRIEVGPDHRWGTAEGSVSDHHAHHLIGTFGVLGSAFAVMGTACAGITGAVLTLRCDRHLVTVALVEVAGAFALALLIGAACLAQARNGARITSSQMASSGTAEPKEHAVPARQLQATEPSQSRLRGHTRRSPGGRA